MKWITGSFLVAFGLAVTQPLHANGLTGSIVDRAGKPIDGALVVVGTSETTRRTVTATDGSFSFSEPLVGTQEVSVRADGYQPITTIVDLDSSSRADLTLDPDDASAGADDPGSTMSTTIRAGAALSWGKASIGRLSLSVPKVSFNLSRTSSSMNLSRPGGSLFTVSNNYNVPRP